MDFRALINQERKKEQAALNKKIAAMNGKKEPPREGVRLLHPSDKSSDLGLRDVTPLRRDNGAQRLVNATIRENDVKVRTAQRQIQEMKKANSVGTRLKTFGSNLVSKVGASLAERKAQNMKNAKLEAKKVKINQGSQSIFTLGNGQGKGLQLGATGKSPFNQSPLKKNKKKYSFGF